MDRRVVVTGTGWVTPLGADVPGVWQKMLAGESAIGPITRFDASSYATNFGGQVNDFDLANFFEPAFCRAHADAGVGTQFALAAAAQAWQQAGLGPSAAYGRVDPMRVGMYLGAGEGSLDYENFMAANLAGWDATSRSVDANAWATVAYEKMAAGIELEQEPHAVLPHLAAAFGCRGPAYNCMTACAASTQAIGEAFEMIRRGDADVMLAGGAHSMLHTLGMTGFIRLTAMSTRRDDPLHASRPFDKTRDGFVMGEGAGIIVLEALDHFLNRIRTQPEHKTDAAKSPTKPTVLAEIAGYGSTADAYRITDMHPDGMGPANAIRVALAGAGINPAEPRQQADGSSRPPVDYISAHGTSTKENDSIETKAIKDAFGDQAKSIAVSSIKAMTGHLIQAAGAVEFITCVQAIQTGTLPPTVNLHAPDDGLDLDYIPNQFRDMRDSGGVEVCLSNSFGFGGQNDSVVVKRFMP